MNGIQSHQIVYRSFYCNWKARPSAFILTGFPAFAGTPRGAPRIPDKIPPCPRRENLRTRRRVKCRVSRSTPPACRRHPASTRSGGSPDISPAASPGKRRSPPRNRRCRLCPFRKPPAKFFHHYTAPSTDGQSPHM